MVRRVGAVLPSSKAAADSTTGRQRRTTLAAIAAEAGVSLPTVSKVVNGRRDVAPATRALVERLRQPLAGMGRAAAQMLDDLIDGLPLRTNRVELSTELIVRESTAPPGPARS